MKRCVVARLCFLATLSALALRVGPAAALDVQACLSESEKGQRARAAGKLREAREHFVLCGADSCPAVVRRDCAEWVNELTQTLPSVVFGARDKKGRDMFDVAVAVDGEVVVTKLDGKAIPIDPGKHSLRFEAPGFAPVTEVVLVKEGERARGFNVTFDAAAPAQGRDAPPARVDRSYTKKEHTIYPWIAVGVGAAAVITGGVIFLTSPERPEGCDQEKETCTRRVNESDEDFKQRQSDAGRSDSQPVLGVVVGGIGLAVAAGGLIWHFLEPTWQVKPLARPWRVTPWMTGRASGLAVGGAF